MYYNQCKYCGANLDPGEKCDCQKETFTKVIKETVNSISDKINPNNTKFA